MIDSPPCAVLSIRQKEKPLYLIVGIWWQERSGLGIAFDHTGAIPVWQSALCQSLYAGGFGPSPHNVRVLTGSMTDQAGESALTNITFTKTRLCFLKQYVHREDFIEYSFWKRS